ncbi:TonB-dependent receptor [Sphingomonas melonis]|uniref:Outer membrane receptor protein involved in Fe transport n=1 Tax=Sphingomonas melonis TaxID=152682 RepID=A0A7Y9FQ75_9SPHN|nr:outer membrane receptor protein involved in Fe transport [Sphingomonas melonis]
MRHGTGGIAACALLLAAPAARAETLPINLPGGTLGQQVTALGRQARISIVVPDRTLWARPVPALRGQLSARAALAAIAARAGAVIVPVGSQSWRLQPAPRSARPRRPTPPVPPPPTAEPKADDIVVTASKRDTRRDDFAGQVVRVPGEELERGGAGGTDRLVQRLTSVTSTYLGAGRNKLFIRGIADSSFTGPTQATVGQYYGDLRLSYNAPDPDLRLADLAAVEVLEGPQGTLYGAGSLGGLIRLVPNPVELDQVAGTAVVGTSATVHGRPGLDAQGVLNLPLVEDRLAVRLVATTAIEGGYIDKPLLGRTDVNRTRIEGGRATAHVDLGAGWSAELIGIGQIIRGADSQYADRDGTPLTRLAAVSEGFRADYGQAQVVASGRIGGVRLRSTSGVTAHDLLERYDATPPGGPPRLFTQANRTRMQANETRAWHSAADGSGWLVGASYIYNRTRLRRLLGAPDAPAPTTGVINSVREWTAYGEGSIRPLAGLLLTGGLRATRSTLDGSAENASPLIAASRSGETAQRTQTIVLPATAALLTLTPGTKLFLRYQQGFRPGGLAIEGDYVRQFRNDRVATIEAGIRHDSPLADVSVTIARASWRDIQADFIDGGGLPSTANIGNGRLWTVEATGTLRPTGGLRLEGAVSYNNGRIDEPSPRLLTLVATPELPVNLAVARAQAFARLEQIPNIAKVTARAGAIYHRDLNGAALTLDGWIRYVGSSRLGVGPVLGQQQGSYLDTEVTARLSLAQFGVTAGVSNLLDTRGNRFALGTPFATGRDQVTPLRPRTFRIGLDTRF